MERRHRTRIVALLLLGLVTVFGFTGCSHGDDADAGQAAYKGPGKPKSPNVPTIDANGGNQGASKSDVGTKATK